jgi:hypothetical protein
VHGPLTATPPYDGLEMNTSIIPLKTGLHLMQILAKTGKMSLIKNYYRSILMCGVETWSWAILIE